MIKLSGQTLTKETWFKPETMALNILERQSTAQITRVFDTPCLQVGDWLLDDCEPGAGIVWRVKTADDNFGTYTGSATLEHIINTLRDISMFGEIKPADITGTEGATTCTAKQAAEYVLSKQSIWTLGDFEYTDSAPFSFNGDDLFSAMEQITSTLEDPCWEYDLSALPFILHIRHKSTETACEMRMSRNISTLRRTIDRSQMYTRIYPIGKKNLHITGDYLSQNENIWGRKDKVETDQSQETEAALRLWAQDRLRRHCEPTVTITIGGLDFSRDTGEALDSLAIGKVCRVPLPDFGITITERITKLSWKNKIKEPDSVTVTLCNNRQDIASIISEQISGGGGGARADAKEKEEDHAWFVDTTSHVAMVAEAIIGRDGETVDWSRVAEIIVDGSGIHQLVVGAQGSLVTAFGRLDMNDESLTTLYQKTGVESLSAGETIYSKVILTAESLATEVSRATSAESGLATRITQTESSISLVVSNGGIDAASIVAAINNAGSTVKITAGHIILDGQTVANSLSADDVIVQELNVGSVFASGTISASNIIADTGHGQISVTGLADDLEGIETSMENAVDGFGTPTASGGQISIPYTQIGGGTGTINFNIADTQFYQDGVSAAAAGVTLSGAWTGTTAAGKAYAVTASNGATRTSPRLNYIGKSDQATWNANNKGFSQALVVLDEDDEFLYQQAVTFDTTASYNAGWAAARAGTGLTLTGNSLQYTYPLAAVDQFGAQTKNITATSVLVYDSTAHTYTATAGAAYGNDVVATDSDTSGTEAYADGYSDGEDSVDFTNQTSGWDDGYWDVYISNGKSTTVAMPGTASWTGDYNALGGYTVSCTVGGKTYYHVFQV